MLSTWEKFLWTWETRLMLGKSRIIFWASVQSFSIFIISSLIWFTVRWPFPIDAIPDCVISSCSCNPTLSCPSIAVFFRINSDLRNDILSRSSGCRSKSASRTVTPVMSPMTTKHGCFHVDMEETGRCCVEVNRRLYQPKLHVHGPPVSL